MWALVNEASLGSVVSDRPRAHVLNSGGSLGGSANGGSHPDFSSPRFQSVIGVATNGELVFFQIGVCSLLGLFLFFVLFFDLVFSRQGFSV